MKRIVCIFIALFLLLCNNLVFASTSTNKSKVSTKQISAISVDGFNINATLSYKKIKGKKVYSTVVLLHSLGYNSQWWGSLPNDLLAKGYAVVSIDLRGHGKSIYNAKLTKVSWSNLSHKAYAKYPDDVIAVMKKIKTDNPKRDFFTNWAIVGSDIGASTGVLVADKLNNKPKTIVMLSPVTSTHGLYIPVSLAQLDNVDIMSVFGENDIEANKNSAYLKKFAQKKFYEYVSNSKSSGMLIIKNNSSLAKVITDWIAHYLH